MQMTLMPKDSGRVYTGQLQSDGMGSGSAFVYIDGIKCSGLVARVPNSEQTVGMASTVGSVSGRNFQATTLGVSGPGGSKIKVLLSCTNGKGLRCELSGQDSRGGGTCVDDDGKQLDVLVVPKT